MQFLCLDGIYEVRGPLLLWVVQICYLSQRKQLYRKTTSVKMVLLLWATIILKWDISRAEACITSVDEPTSLYCNSAWTMMRSTSLKIWSIHNIEILALMRFLRLNRTSTLTRLLAAVGAKKLITCSDLERWMYNSLGGQFSCAARKLTSNLQKATMIV